MTTTAIDLPEKPVTVYRRTLRVDRAAAEYASVEALVAFLLDEERTAPLQGELAAVAANCGCTPGDVAAAVRASLTARSA